MALPWPSRPERKAAVGRARGERERSQRSAAEAEDIARDIRWLYQQNHWASSVADALGIHPQKGNGE